MSKYNIGKPWSKSADKILSELEVKDDEGLSPAEVKKRRKEYGRNKLRESETKNVWKILVDQFNSLIVIILLVAVGLSFLFGQTIEAFAILAVVIVNGVVGFFTEYRAVKSMEGLKQLTKVKAKVRRKGKTKVIRADNLVPGDIVIIEGGDIVSADIRLIESNKLQVDESTLTGESVPVSKSIDEIEKDTELADRRNMLFNGTAVTRGSGEGVAVSTGMNTELGNISELVEEAEEETTPLEKRLDDLGKKLIRLTIGLAAAVGIIGFLRGKELFLMIETAVALAIAAIPEGLPIVATIALARGMMIMAKRNTLINRLASVETLGATNRICVDKTGTLTENKMTMNKLLLSDGMVEITGEGFEPEGEFKRDDKTIDPAKDKLLSLALEIGVLCNNASLPDEDEDSIGDPLEVALLVAGAKAGFKRNELLEKYPEEKEIAFDADTMMMATFNKSDDKLRVTVKGAPEQVINSCNSILTPDGKENLNEDDKKDWLDKNEQLAQNGLRVLAFAINEASSIEDDPYKGMTLIGLAGLLDPPRQGVKEAIGKCKDANIELIMVTGDHPSTAQQIAESVGLIEEKDGKYSLGKDLKNINELSEEKIDELTNEKIFARVTPKQKLNLISLHQKKGNIVAMTGDGVNDAPALKKADIGIAMGKRGTQVAKDASDMILQDDSLSSIVAAIEQGRTIFNNIRKFVLYLLSGNMGEILAVAVTFLAIAALPLYPLQILFLNFGIDVFPALAVGMGGSEKNIMDHPPRDPKEPILNKKGWIFIWLFGAIIAVSILASFTISQTVLGLNSEEAVTISFLTLGFSRLWHVFNMRGDDSNFFINEITKNKYIWTAFGICFILLLAAIYLPPVASILNTRQPNFEGWLLVLGSSFLPLIVGQLLKLFGGKLH